MSPAAASESTTYRERRLAPWRAGLVCGLLVLTLFTHGPVPESCESPIATATTPTPGGSTPPGGPARIDAQPALLQWRVRQDYDPLAGVF